MTTNSPDVASIGSPDREKVFCGAACLWCPCSAVPPQDRAALPNDPGVVGVSRPDSREGFRRTAGLLAPGCSVPGPGLIEGRQDRVAARGIVGKRGELQVTRRFELGPNLRFESWVEQ